MLPAIERRLAGQWPVAIDSGLQGQIVAQLVVIVLILVAQSQSVDPLTQQAQSGMIATGATAWIVQNASDLFEQTKAAVDLMQQDGPATVAGDVTAGKGDFDFAAF